MAPRVSNPRKQFRFSISIVAPDRALLEAYLVQEVTHPENTIEQDVHGDVNYDVKTAGRVSTGNATISKILTTSGPDNYLWNWHESCQSPRFGGGLIPSQYKKRITVTEYAEGADGGILNIWTWHGCWPTKINGQTQNRQESGNTIESVEFSVDYITKV